MTSDWRFHRDIHDNPVDAIFEKEPAGGAGIIHRAL
jgi:hypothetical protein